MTRKLLARMHCAVPAAGASVDMEALRAVARGAMDNALKVDGLRPGRGTEWPAECAVEKNGVLIGFLDEGGLT